MKFTLRYPMQAGCDPRLLTTGTIARVACAAENAGFGAIAFTEHPAPSTEWLESGGHHSLDVLTALAFVAGLTSRIRLLTYLLVLPYRNPLLLAKQVSTADILSGGRLTLAIGTGYLRSEFAALGVNFDERNELFDECAELLTRAWTSATCDFEGRHFLARSQVLIPSPVQLPHPPLWIGGNSRRSLSRAATFGQGWTPIIMDERKSLITRTPALTSPAALASAISELRQRASDLGRDGAALDIQAQWTAVNDLTAGYSAVADAAGQLADAGATWAVFEPPGDEAEQTIDVIAAFGANVIKPNMPQ